MPLILNGTTGISGVDGSAGTPSYVGADTDTGVLFPAANTLALSTGGTERVRVDSSGNVGIGTSSPNSKLHVSSSGTTYAQVTGNSRNLYLGQDADGAVVYSDGAVPMRFFTNTAERMRITSGGSVGIGTTTPTNYGGTTVSINSPGESYLDMWYAGTRQGILVGASGKIVLAGVSTNPITFEAGGNEHMRITDGGLVGIGTTSPSSFAGKVVVNGGLSLLNANRLYLWSSSNGFAPAIYAPSESIAFTDNNGVETLRVGSTGVLTLKGGNNAASGVGITFPATQSASSDANTLDDYEEGTWTPSIGGNATYTVQSGKYRKIGSLVFIDCELYINVIGTGSVSRITGIPFTPASGGGSSGGTVAYASGLNTNLVFLSFRVDPGGTTIYNAGMTAAAATTTDDVSIFKNAARVLFSITYIAA